MEFLSGCRKQLGSQEYTELAAYRYRVFVEHLGWELGCPEGFEADQFDRDDTLYVISHDPEGRINGCARLLPTVRPYLLKDVFPELLNGATPPVSEDVWELSRFTAFTLEGRMESGVGQFSSPVAVELLRESIACAARQGARRLITVSPLGVERLLRRAGFRAHRAGPPIIVGGYPLFACWIDVDAQTVAGGESPVGSPSPGRK
ncbi:acyl-homoserine-lactone synthase [Nitrogeniibacter aestuarii]|uniref:acyl-homoserine-lactone synthase n=1 Tax=Nitrogeniibacter aestuarii TaxID=2815343 RepID=UPI001D0FD126|nr:acyl-homoserine-lactone synthase [Nitrogeniibacter aestuarii]